MILFLDIVSSLPEFSLIEDNKIIYSKEIVIKDNIRMSDSILPAYLELEKKFSLSQNLKLLITNTGPGSYTALRVGIAFLSGLSLAKNIELKGISCLDLSLFLISEEECSSSVIFIRSSNNQKFLCIYNNFKNKYKIIKIENENEIFNLNTSTITNLLTNDESIYKNVLFSKNIKYVKIDFKTIVLNNMCRIKSLKSQKIIEPIYISNNKILN